MDMGELGCPGLVLGITENMNSHVWAQGPFGWTHMDTEAAAETQELKKKRKKAPFELNYLTLKT